LEYAKNSCESYLLEYTQNVNTNKTGVPRLTRTNQPALAAGSYLRRCRQL